MPASADVIVIGGGPAGSTAATMLARRGFRVSLFERETFPRHHVGESLLPASMPILEALGVSQQVADAGFLKKWGATMVWGQDDRPWSWHFRETNRRYPHAYQVWRPRFDQILLENSRAAGVEVHEGAPVTSVIFDGDAATGVRYTLPGGATRELHARHIVDASGQAGLIGRNLKLRTNDPGFQNLAIYAYWRGADRLPEPDETNIFIEAYEHGWTWAIPLHTGLMSVGAVVDNRDGQAGIRASGAGRYYAGQLAAAPHTSRMLSRASLESGPFVIRDWSYSSSRLTGPGYVLCGDAACFIDPLFSTGVHLALSSGTMAAAYVSTALNNPPFATDAAEAYADLYNRQYSQFRELARLFYASNHAVESIFWEVRRFTGAEEFTPREAFVRATAGQSAQGYERVVLEHGALPDQFTEGIHAFERRWAERESHVAQLQSCGRLMRCVPSLRPGTSLKQQAVLGDGEFVPGVVLQVPGRGEPTPVSGFVARLVELINGARSVDAICATLARQIAGAGNAQVAGNVSRAISILYIDGIVEELRESASP